MGNCGYCNLRDGVNMKNVRIKFRIQPLYSIIVYYFLGICFLIMLLFLGIPKNAIKPIKFSSFSAAYVCLSWRRNRQNRKLDILLNLKAERKGVREHINADALI